jgi:hypothetical protein
MIAPEVVRTSTPRTGGERELLDAWLDWHRATLLAKCAGLDEIQLRTSSAEPSPLSLLGLVRHMTEVERGWFIRGFADRGAGPLYYTDADPDGDFAVEGADAEADLAAFRTEIDRARAAVAALPLDATFSSGDGTQTSLRWVYLHMIEEYARHNGHADLLRERIDGVIGD